MDGRAAVKMRSGLIDSGVWRQDTHYNEKKIDYAPVLFAFLSYEACHILHFVGRFAIL